MQFDFQLTFSMSRTLCPGGPLSLQSPIPGKLVLAAEP